MEGVMEGVSPRKMTVLHLHSAGMGADTVRLSLGTPQSLHYNFSRPDVLVVTNELGWLRQGQALDRIIDITTNSAASYLLAF